MAPLTRSDVTIDGQRSPARSMATTVIRFREISVRGREVSGELELYRDPLHGLPVRTIFRGTLGGCDRIVGTYTMSSEGYPALLSGEWHVARTASRDP